MASRIKSLARPAINLLKSAAPKPTSSVRTPPSPFSRPLTQITALQTLLPLHTAISSARLTSCLAADTIGCRSMSQELGLCVPR